MPKIAIFTLIAAIAALSACATAPPPIQDTSSAKSSTGYAVLRLNTNWSHNGSALLATLEFSYFAWGRGAPGDSKSAHKRSQLMRSASDFVLLELEEGTYYWNAIGFGDYYLPLSMNSSFTVENGKITYLGDITHNLSIHGFKVSNDRLSVSDNDSQAQEQLRQEYPGIYSNHPYQKQLTKIEPWQQGGYKSRAAPPTPLFECREPTSMTESGVCP